jgi:hypothetical protein
LDEIRQDGFDATITNGRALHHRRRLLRDWMATPDWTESSHFLTDHFDELQAEETLRLLADDQTTAARRHLAIALLSQGRPTAQVYEIVTEPDVAEQEIVSAIEHGDLKATQLLLAAAPGILARPITGRLVLLVLALAIDDIEHARECAEAIVEGGTMVEREATAQRLRNLVRFYPDLSAGVMLAALIHPEEGS